MGDRSAGVRMDSKRDRHDGTDEAEPGSDDEGHIEVTAVCHRRLPRRGVAPPVTSPGSIGRIRQLASSLLMACAVSGLIR